MREGYLRFDVALGLVQGPPQSIDRAARHRVMPMYERSEAYGKRPVIQPPSKRDPATVQTRVERERRLSSPRVRQARRVSQSPPPALRHGTITAADPVSFSSWRHDADSLDGTSLVHGRPSVGEVKQWSGTILRLFDTTGTGSTRHRAKFRAVVYYDGTNAVRFSIYRDPDAARGFDRRSRYELSMHQAQVLPPRDERPAEVHVSYDGQATVDGKGTIAFDGVIMIRGDGTVACTTPTIHSGTGKAAVLRNAATIGWW